MTPDDISQHSEPNNRKNTYELTDWKKCIYSVPFWQFMFMMICGCYFGTFFSYTFKQYGSDTVSHKQIPESFLAMSASVGAGLVNGMTRIVFGTF